MCDLLLFSLPIAIITSLRMSVTKKVKLSFILMPGLLVIAISCARMYLVIVGQWEADESWSYDYLLAVEVSEIGSTLVALSIPGLKPLFGSLFASFDKSFSSRRDTSPRSKIDVVTADQDTKEHQIEMGGVFNRARSRVLHQSRGSKDVPEDINKAVVGVGDAYVLRDAHYSAKAFHTGHGRRTSAASGLSQQPIIQREMQYTVSHEEMGNT